MFIILLWVIRYTDEPRFAVVQLHSEIEQCSILCNYVATRENAERWLVNSCLCDYSVRHALLHSATMAVL